MRPIEAIKNMSANTLQKFDEVTHDRCEKCPAFWENVDNWGEYDAGCTLDRDHLEFCALSLLPKLAMKVLVKRKEKAEERMWERIEKEEMAKWEKAESEGEVQS